MKPYRLAIDWDALEALRVRSRSEQRAVAEHVGRLCNDPFQLEPYTERDETGRINQVAVIGRLLGHYWSDHTECMVRVTRIEMID